ncbi:formate dehydrogenase subunit beta [Shewanella chilikensis]|nr:formate dehydrogenase subunit beta [Shewanella chilikensis]MCE9850858.1 formate dehydrogenase subunit beta [Shewanella chilikensis]MCL1162286.1 formate dehydrogenase subunit beta [Shewanella chilikensis]QTE88864.1 formate dehydrogenase subunit beta [Shewanella algae]
MIMATQDIIRRSGTSAATPASQTRIGDIKQVAKLFDATKCNGCKACQVACSEWNDLREEVGSFEGSYQNPMKLSGQVWTLMEYNEVMDERNKLRWQFTHSACMHCADPACLKACSTAGAIVQHANGVVDFDSDKCVGCGYCASACPFDIPKIDPKDNKAYKCTMCSDRLAVGLEPSCVKTCTTGALRFGTREDMLFYADKRVAELKERGFAKAGLYNPEGVGGTAMMMILHDVTQPESYNMPEDPQIPLSVTLWQDWVKPLGTVGILATAAVACLHKITVGRNIVEEDQPGYQPPEEDQQAAQKEEDGK